jgi:hypothetical protein
MESVDEEDPRAMAHFMGKLSAMTGMPLGDAAHEAIRRLEAGDDPEQVEAGLGELFGEDGSPDALFAKGRLAGLKRRLAPPEQDDTLYPL